MTDKFLAGASEAPLTNFTASQMDALKIYSKIDGPYPCQSLNLEKSANTMVLGEAASSFCLETSHNSADSIDITGIGYATEKIEHSASLSARATCLQESMKMAILNLPKENIDAIIMHAPGTVKGDLAEYKAIEQVFGKNIPFLTSNKWKLGHTFATSGLLSMEMALIMLENQEYFHIPYLPEQKTKNTIRNILINAVGFGGNAVSILLSKKIE